MTGKQTTILCILDGWGLRSPASDNAIDRAKTPNWDRLMAAQPRSQLNASSTDVGLPAGQMGNSEVGHMNIGAGRVVLQDLLRIEKAFADGALATDSRLASAARAIKQAGGCVHLMGLMSPGGVHAMQAHILELARLLSALGVPVAVHAFLDGRDTPPRAGCDYLRQFIDDIAPLPGVRLATVCGRYWAMDRDKRWDRVARAHAALVDADAPRHDDPLAAIQASYDADKGDEFVDPMVIGDYAGMKDGDGLLMANFRADRAREILHALVDPDFDGFARARQVGFSVRLGMVSYSTALDGLMDSLFPPVSLKNGLGEWIAAAGRTQLRLAETEKYAHVTFFLNGGTETVFDGEDRILVPSPKVATYDLQPEMSAPEVTDHLVAAIDSGEFDLIVVNYANGDMVGHTGIMDAAMAAAETIDQCLGELEAAVRRNDGRLLITADHGNCEMMRDPDSGQPHTAHTLNPVPFILVGGPADITLSDGVLADVAPTVLDLMGLAAPPEMTGHSLIAPYPRRAAS